MEDGDYQYPKRLSDGGRAEGRNSIFVVAVRRIMAIVHSECRRVHYLALDGRVLWC